MLPSSGNAPDFRGKEERMNVEINGGNSGVSGGVNFFLLSFLSCLKDLWVPQSKTERENWSHTWPLPLWLAAWFTWPPSVSCTEGSPGILPDLHPSWHALWNPAPLWPIKPHVKHTHTKLALKIQVSPWKVGKSQLKSGCWCSLTFCPVGCVLECRNTSWTRKQKLGGVGSGTVTFRKSLGTSFSSSIKWRIYPKWRSLNSVSKLFNIGKEILLKKISHSVCSKITKYLYRTVWVHHCLGSQSTDCFWLHFKMAQTCNLRRKTKIGIAKEMQQCFLWGEGASCWSQEIFSMACVLCYIHIPIWLKYSM